jgi:hypothetical protein
MFGKSETDVDAMDAAKKILDDEHYHVSSYSDADGSANFDNFVGMARGGVVIFDTHGGGDIIKTPKVTLGKYTIPSVTVSDAGLLVEWRKDFFDAAGGAIGYIKKYKLGVQDVAVDLANREGVGLQWAISITNSGLAKFFGHANLGIVFGGACDSMRSASSFQAKSYFGFDQHQHGIYITAALGLLMNSLAGQDTIAARSTTGYAAQNEFTFNMKLAPNAEPVVLSPAVASGTLGDGAVLKRGGNTPFTVQFDAHMRQNEGIVTVEGCDARVVDPKLSGPTLTFKLNVPQHPRSTTAKVTLNAKNALASGGYPAELDGNETPSGTTGQAPNRDNYTVKVRCSEGLGINLSGTADGFILKGELGGTGSSVTCQNTGSTNRQAATEIFANGVLPNGVQAGLEIGVSAPGGTFGPGGSAQGTLTLDLYPGRPPKQDHAGGAGGGQFGTGSGTISISASGGTINATLDDGVQVTGSWKCGAPNRKTA